MRVIAIDHFTDDSGVWHQHGHEFDMDDTPERARRLDDGSIREDDRLPRPKVVPPASPEQAKGDAPDAG